MKMLNLSAMLYTTNIAASVEFYASKLGFSCKSMEAQWGWAKVERDSLQVMFSLPNEHIPFSGPHFTGSFYFLVDDVVEFWQQIKDSVEVCYPLETFDYGMMEFAIYDNNGYMLQFGQETII